MAGLETRNSGNKFSLNGVFMSEVNIYRELFLVRILFSNETSFFVDDNSQKLCSISILTTEQRAKDTFDGVYGRVDQDH